MKVLYITYWGLNDGLSVSTSHNSLRALSSFDCIRSIVYYTVERPGRPSFPQTPINITKVTHYPITIPKINIKFLSKSVELITILRTLWAKISEISPDLIIYRGSILSIFAVILKRIANCPIVIESFEPHSSYMRESGVWTIFGPSYILSRVFEKLAQRTADALVVVSRNYLHHLYSISSINPAKLFLSPCVVQLNEFRFSVESRDSVRASIDASEKDVVGIYTGKFGGIYYDESAFALFRVAYEFFNHNFKLILLSPDPRPKLEAKLQNHGFPLAASFIKTVAHKDVSSYLSAADFAFSPIKSTPSRAYCSAIKHGEYWANGLPILLPEGIGDDSAIIRAEGGGSIFNIQDPSSIQQALNGIQTILSNPDHRLQICLLAQKYRNPSIQLEVYAEILACLVPQSLFDSSTTRDSSSFC